MRRPPVTSETESSEDGSTKESRFAKVKRIISGTLQLRRSSQDNKDSKMARKRDREDDEEKCNKEDEVIEKFDRKLVRSNSEERPLNIINKELSAVKVDNIRRVSSHEDFKKNGKLEKEPLHEINNGKFSSFINDENTPIIIRHCSPNKTNISPNRDPKAHFFDDSDSSAAEKRRQSERFSRPRGRSKLSTSNTSSKPKKRKTSKYIHHVDHSETISIDLKTLHEQIDSSEPIISTYKFDEEIPPILSSPRNSIILAHKDYLEPLISTKIAVPKPHHRNPIESRIRHISKQVNSIKKKLKKDEMGGEERFSEKKIRGLHMELSKLKKEMKGLKTGFEPDFAVMTARILDSSGPSKSDKEDEDLKKRVELVTETMVDIQRKLTEKRQYGNRPEEVNEMTEEQLIEEKTAVQKALLHLESIHGRPITKEDRDIVRPLYDRYRILKRNVARTTIAKLNNSVELGTILEHEAMHFVSTSITSDPSKQEQSSSELSITTVDDTSDTDTSINENLHALTYEELLGQLKQAREEKKQIRRTIKEYEHEFEEKMGRKLQKDDRVNSSFENTYFTYKQVKGKLKLIEILLEKKRPEK